MLLLLVIYTFFWYDVNIRRITMEWITAHYQDILAIVGAVVTAATVIVGITPTTKDDEILGKIVRLLDFVSVLPVKK